MMNTNEVLPNANTFLYLAKATSKESNNALEVMISFFFPFGAELKKKIDTHTHMH